MRVTLVNQRLLSDVFPDGASFGEIWVEEGKSLKVGELADDEGDALTLGPVFLRRSSQDRVGKLAQGVDKVNCLPSNLRWVQSRNLTPGFPYRRVADRVGGWMRWRGP